MNVFAEKIIEYDRSQKVEWAHGLRGNPPLPLGSAIKLSRLALDNNIQPNPDISDRLKHELFEERMSPWKNGVFVRVIAAPEILVPPNNDNEQWTKRRKLWLHLVKKDLFHLVKQQDEYEWWEPANEKSKKVL